MIRSKNDLLDVIRKYVGDRTDDDSLAVLEDLNDTVDDYEKRLGDTTDWKGKYEQNDSEWRKRYRERFDGEAEDNGVHTTTEDVGGVRRRSYDDLFKTE